MYRLKHIPTGYYFCPSREVKAHWTRPEDGRKFSNYVRTNLSKKGKVYQSRPSFKYIGDEFYNHLAATPKEATHYQISYAWLTTEVTPFVASEWEIEEIS